MSRTFAAPLCLALIAVACAGTSEVRPDDPAGLLDLGRRQLEQAEYGAARSTFRDLVEEHPEAPEAEEAAWLAGEASYRREAWEGAVNDYQAYYEEYPLSRLGELEVRMFELGELLYEEGGQGLLGLGILTSSAPAFETMEWIVEKIPTGYRADNALFFLGRKLYEEERDQEALVYLETLLRDHPQSEWFLEARFYEGLCHWRLNRGAAYDRRHLVRARESYSTYIHDVTRDPARETEYADRLARARAAIREIDDTLAEKYGLIAEFYETQERPDAARIYAGLSVEQSPESEAAAESRELLREIGEEGR